MEIVIIINTWRSSQRDSWRCDIMYHPLLLWARTIVLPDPWVCAIVWKSSSSLSSTRRHASWLIPLCGYVPQQEIIIITTQRSYQRASWWHYIYHPLLHQSPGVGKCPWYGNSSSLSTCGDHLKELVGVCTREVYVHLWPNGSSIKLLHWQSVVRIVPHNHFKKFFLSDFESTRGEPEQRPNVHGQTMEWQAKKTSL